MIEIENLIIDEPTNSLRDLARKVEVETGEFGFGVGDRLAEGIAALAA